MRTTLFYIPDEMWGWPTFGFGVLLVAWLVACAIILTLLTWQQGWSSDTKAYLPLMGLVAVIVALVLPRVAEPGLGLPIRGYGVMLLSGVVAGLQLALARARKAGIDPEHIYSMALSMFVAGIAGARLFYVIEYWDQFQRDSFGETLGSMVNITQGGLVVYGSLFGALPLAWLYVRRHGLNWLQTADIIAPSLLLGLALGRIGCFLNGCCFGAPCEVPWAVSFPAGSPPFMQQLEQNRLFVQGLKLGEDESGRVVVAEVEPDSAAERAGIKSRAVVVAVQDQRVTSIEEAMNILLQSLHAPRVSLSVADQSAPLLWPTESAYSLRVQPSQLYSAIGAALICCFLLTYEPLKSRHGELLAWVFTIYPVVRFLEEVIRVDEAAVFHTGLSISQNISLGLLLIGVAFWAYLLRSPAGMMSSAARPK